MTKQLTADQVQTLSAYERYFTQATRAAWCSYPGQAAIHKMLDIWAELTGSPYPYKPGCPNCLLNLVRDMGTIYFAAKEALVSELREKAKGETFREVQIGDYKPTKPDSFNAEAETPKKASKTITRKKKAVKTK